MSEEGSTPLSPPAPTAAKAQEERRPGLRLLPLLFLIVIGGAIIFPLGSREMVFPAGTIFDAPRASAILMKDRFDRTLVYRIPAGSMIHYDQGRTDVADTTFDMTAEPSDGSPFAVPLEVDKPHMLAGSEIAIPANVTAKSHRAGITWGTFGLTMLIPIMLIAAFYGRRIRVGRWAEAFILACVLLGGALALGTTMDRADSILNNFRGYFDVPAAVVAGELMVAIALYAFLFCVMKLPGIRANTASAKKETGTLV